MAKNRVQISKFPTRVRQCLSDFVYGSFRLGLILLFRSTFRVRVVGKENCPKKGPLLVISNHISEWDPPFLGSCIPWQVHWMAKVELFELCAGKMHGFFRMLHCIPVDREKADLSAVKQVVRLLKEERPVVVFAEGGIRNDETSILGENPQLKEGAATMALLAGCPILPVVLNGTVAAYRWQSWLRFRKCLLEVVIGPPFQLQTKDRKEATQEILKRLLELKAKLVQQKVA